MSSLSIEGDWNNNGNGKNSGEKIEIDDDDDDDDASETNVQENDDGGDDDDDDVEPVKEMDDDDDDDDADDNFDTILNGQLQKKQRNQAPIETARTHYSEIISTPAISDNSNSLNNTNSNSNSNSNSNQALATSGAKMIEERRSPI